MTSQIAIAAPTNHPVRPDSSQIAAASKTETRWFIGGLVWLIASTLLTAWIGLMAWQASNRRQELEALDANARISEGRAIAGQANERAAKLELDAATQRERAAKAEKSLLELQQKIAPLEHRHLTDAEFKTFMQFLARDPRGSVDMVFTDDPESRNFAGEIANGLAASGWTVSTISERAFTSGPGGNVRGVTLGISDFHRPPARSKTLQDALRSIGIPAVANIDPGLPEDAVQLTVWPNPAEPIKR